MYKKPRQLYIFFFVCLTVSTKIMATDDIKLYVKNTSKNQRFYLLDNPPKGLKCLSSLQWTLYTMDHQYVNTFKENLQFVLLITDPHTRQPVAFKPIGLRHSEINEHAYMLQEPVTKRFYTLRRTLLFSSTCHQFETLWSLYNHNDCYIGPIHHIQWGLRGVMEGSSTASNYYYYGNNRKFSFAELQGLIDSMYY